MRWTIFFIILAFISAIFGFGDLAGNLAFLAKLCFFVFVALFIGTVYKFISEH